MALLIEIIIFYILHKLGAPGWCYFINSVSIILTLSKYAVFTGNFISAGGGKTERNKEQNHKRKGTNKNG